MKSLNAISGETRADRTKLVKIGDYLISRQNKINLIIEKFLKG